MGWVAAGGSAIIAAFAIHSFFSRNNGTLLSARSPKVSALNLRESIIEERDTTNDELSFDISPPSIAIQEVEDFPLQLQHTESVPERPPPPQNLMAPPPPRARSSSPPRLKSPAFGVMPAPPRLCNGYGRPPPSAAASLRVPQTKVLSNTSMAPSLGASNKPVAKQAILRPGYSPLDWAALTSDPASNLRGKDVPDRLIKVTPSQLKQQNGKKGRDAWTSFQGKVYNITPYLPFHPGGKGELMRGAGKDCGRLFMETHPWVNIDMLKECLVGIIVAEDESKDERNQLDEMD